MKRDTLFLKIALFLVGIPILVLCVAVWPGMPRNPDEVYFLALAVFLYLTAIPFYTALYHTFKLLQHIDQGTFSSASSLAALHWIKRCALVISGLYVLGIPLFFVIARIVDAPGIALLGMIVLFVSVVIAVIVNVWQRLWQNVHKQTTSLNG